MVSVGGLSSAFLNGLRYDTDSAVFDVKDALEIGIGLSAKITGQKPARPVVGDGHAGPPHKLAVEGALLCQLVERESLFVREGEGSKMFVSSACEPDCQQVVAPPASLWFRWAVRWALSRLDSHWALS